MEPEDGEVHSDNGLENEQPHVVNGFAVDVHSEDEHDVANGFPEHVVIIDEPESEPDDEPMNEPLNQPLVVNGFPAHVYSDNESENEQEDEPHVAVIVNEPDDEPQEDGPVYEADDEPESESEDEQEDGPVVNEPQDNIVPEMKEISEDDWNQMLENVKLEKEYMDKLVMDYLVNRELPEVAQAFHQGTGCPLGINDISLLEVQKNVRELILNRQFDEAIDLLNDRLRTIFLMDRPQLNFHLDQQKMIEMCRRDDITSAITFSRKFNEWENFEFQNDNFKKEFRRTMLLMIYGNDPNSTVADLLHPLRCSVIVENAVEEMIKFQGHDTDSQLERALKTLKLEQDQLNLVLRFPNFDINSGLEEHEHD